MNMNIPSQIPLTSPRRGFFRIQHLLQIIQQPILIHRVALPLLVEPLVEPPGLDELADVDVGQGSGGVGEKGGEEGCVECFAGSRGS
jgi:hypothetical protein